MTVNRARVKELFAFARDHESEPARVDDLVAAKSALLRRVLGPDADADVVGPMTFPGDTNGIVLHEGQVVAEFGDTSFVAEIASATKSFLGLIAGVAIDDGLIADVDGRVVDTVTLAEFHSDHNRRITWRHLLYQSERMGRDAVRQGPRGSPRRAHRRTAPRAGWVLGVQRRAGQPPRPARCSRYSAARSPTCWRSG